MTAKKCRCNHDSPFMWKHDHRPSVFAKDPYFRGHGAVMLSNKAQNIINVKQFTVYSKAGKIL